LSGGGDGGGGDGTWSCSQCTFINSLVDTLCIMCSSSAPAARKRKRNRRARNAQSGSGSDNGTGRTWVIMKSERNITLTHFYFSRVNPAISLEVGTASSSRGEAYGAARRLSPATIAARRQYRLMMKRF
jgi:hypothetical protein